MRESRLGGLFVVFAKISRSVEKLFRSDWRLEDNFRRRVGEGLAVNTYGFDPAIQNIAQGLAGGIEARVATFEERAHVGGNQRIGHAFEGLFIFVLLEIESAGEIKVDDAVVIAGYRADAPSARGIFESYESHESSKEETILADYEVKTALTLFFEMRKNSLAEKFGLTRAVVAPDFEHDVRATGGTILFDALDALVGSAGNGADFAKDFVSHRFSGCSAATFFHRVRDGLKLFKAEAGAFEQGVSGAFDVLHIIGEVHVRLQRWNGSGEDFSLIFEWIAPENAFDDLNALAHDGGWSDFFPFPLSDFLHEDLGSAETEEKSITGEILHDARFHGDLHGMARVG